MSNVDDQLGIIDAEIRRRDAAEDAARLSGDLRAFVKEAWTAIKPVEVYKHNWHIDAICEHLMAVTAGDIRKLQVWIPRGMMKSLTVSVFWPAWEWTSQPNLRYWTAIYELGLAGRIAALSRNVMISPWYQARWGHMFRLMKTSENYFSNDKGGTRLATAPGSTALGEHGHRIIIDDPINAVAADATSRVTLDATNEWYDATVQGSKADPTKAAEVIIMQRLHENDLAAHAYEQAPHEWEILCLPARYEHDHPHVYFKDPRKEGDLLWPEYLDEAATVQREQTLGPYRRAGQMQQRPSAREGDLLKRYWWRFYDPELFTNPAMANRRPRFSRIVQSVDTPLKDKQINDRVAIQAWGVVGADRYLLDLKVGHMSKGQAYRAILEQCDYVRDVAVFGPATYNILIENAGYGVELIEELKRVRSGVLKLSRAREGDKELRAEAAAAGLESGNHFLPGFRQGGGEMSMPRDDLNAAVITEFIDECAGFPNSRWDDQVDSWSQTMNWLSTKVTRPARVYSSFAAA